MVDEGYRQTGVTTLESAAAAAFALWAAKTVEKHGRYDR